MQIATNALHEALDARRTVYSERDDATAAFRPRAAAGLEIAALRHRVSMPLRHAPDLFHAALARGADLHIADAAAPSVRSRLPEWLVMAFPDAPGFVLLPVMLEGRPMGFFYAERRRTGEAAPDATQIDAIRTLRTHVVLALRTAPAAG